MRGIIYKYTSPSNKVYIGQTIKENHRRTVFLNLNCSYGGKKIDNARSKYNPYNFTYEVLEEYDIEDIYELKDTLDKQETYYISLYDSYENGYNSTLGGDYGVNGMKHSDETKQLLSSISKERWQDEAFRTKWIETHTGELNPFYGKHHSEETKEKISKSNKGKTKNIPKTEEHKQKISESLKDKKKSKEHIDNIVKTKYKKVYQYDLNGNLLNTFESVKECGVLNGIDRIQIAKVCRGERKQYKGYVFSYT